MTFIIDRHDPIVSMVICYLRLLNIKCNSAVVNESMQNHPDWPSLLCISDTLREYNIPNAAGKITSEEIDQLPTPFLITINDRRTPIYIVKGITSDTVELIKENNSNVISMAKEEFLKLWTGIYLIAEPNEYSQEKNYKRNRTKSLVASLLPVLSILILIFLGGTLLYDRLYLISNITYSIPAWMQFVLFVIGGIFSSLLLWYEVDKSNPILKKVCTGIKNGNCDAILSSKQAKLFNWMTWSEVGFIYFLGGLGILVFNSYVSSSISFLLWLNILAVPYTIFSVYYQWRIVKEWCILCLGVQAVLFLAFILSVWIINKDTISVFILSDLPRITLFYLATALIWYLIKPYLYQMVRAKIIKREYNRIKYNNEIFETLLQKQPKLDYPVDGMGIDIGNAITQNLLVKVCNPYCGPCAKAHPLIEELVDQNIVNAKIIFTTTISEMDPGKKPVEHLLAIAALQDETLTKKALDDWYLPANRSYKIFAEKYPMNGELYQQEDKIKKMNEWCRQMQITHTPTIYLNGYQLPDAYSIEDLKYFLLE